MFLLPKCTEGPARGAYTNSRHTRSGWSILHVRGNSSYSDKEQVGRPSGALHCGSEECSVLGLIPAFALMVQMHAAGCLQGWLSAGEDVAADDSQKGAAVYARCNSRWLAHILTPDTAMQSGYTTTSTTCAPSSTCPPARRLTGALLVCPSLFADHICQGCMVPRSVELLMRCRRLHSARCGHCVPHSACFANCRSTGGRGTRRSGTTTQPEALTLPPQ